jgi:hypothetical protein
MRSAHEKRDVWNQALFKADMLSNEQISIKYE